MDNQQPSSPPPWAQTPADLPPAKPWWSNPKTVLPLVGLVVVLLVVIFWLPTQIQVPQHPSPDGQDSGSTTAAKPALSESPWSDAQLAKQRREAQDILARLLDKQQALESASVNLWAVDAFAAASDQANAGDDLYRQRLFDEAKQSYLNAEQAMDALLAQVDEQFAEYLQLGKSALDNNQPKQALTALTIAAAIDTSDSEAAGLLARAEVLEQIIVLVKESDQAIKLHDLNTAASKLNQARALDNHSAFVEQKQTELGGLQKQLSFGSRMSNGYSALQQQDYATAIAAFQAALALNPGAQDAQAALAQARNAASQTKINSAIARAKQLAEQEQWAKAVKQYDRALQQDPSLVSAKVDRIKADARRQLDETLVKLLADPLRLSDDQVYRSAQKALSDAQPLATPGSRLEQQVNELNQAIEVAQTPVTVTFTSDNQTKVTLYRVGQLGEFEQHTINLKPGQYVLVGSRSGFRDVRKEFTVQANQQQTIQIQCTEPVANG